MDLETFARRLTDRYTAARPCLVRGSPDAHTVWLSIAGEDFHLACYRPTRRLADRERLRLGRALARLITKETDP